MLEARVAVQSGVSCYLSEKLLEVRGSKGTVVSVPVVITTFVDIDGDRVSIAVYSRGENGNPDKIQMLSDTFPGTAESFLQGITVTDPDALPLSLKVIALGPYVGKCISARDDR